MFDKSKPYQQSDIQDPCDHGELCSETVDGPNHAELGSETDDDPSDKEEQLEDGSDAEDGEVEADLGNKQKRARDRVEREDQAHDVSRNLKFRELLLGRDAGSRWPQRARRSSRPLAPVISWGAVHFRYIIWRKALNLSYTKYLHPAVPAKRALPRSKSSLAKVKRVKTNLDTLPHDPPPSPPAPSPAAVSTCIKAALRFAINWSPTGRIIGCDFRWSFKEFVELLEDVSRQELDPGMGYQYEIGDRREVILTNEDEYRTFIGRIQKTPKGTRELSSDQRALYASLLITR